MSRKREPFGRKREMDEEFWVGEPRGYLRATGKRVGLLLNFGEHPLGIKRMVNRYDG